MGTLKFDDGRLLIQQAGKWSEIGQYDLNRKILTVYRDKSKHLMKVFDAYGFNREILETDRFFEYVVIDEIDGNEHNLYLIPRADIIEKGRLYQAEGYERQIFMSLSQIKEYKMS